MDVSLFIVDISLHAEMDVDQWGCFERDYGKITKDWEVNALPMDNDHYFVPINKWHKYHGNERRFFYRYAHEDLEKARNFWRGSLCYIGAIVKARVLIKILNETFSDELYASVCGIENNDYTGIYFRELLSEMRSRLSRLGFSMLELDAMFEKFAKTSDKDLRWEVI